MNRWPINNTRCAGKDIHETLVREIYAQGIPKPDPNYTQAVVETGTVEPETKPYLSIKDATFYFDSTYRDLASGLTTGQIAFSITAVNSLNPIQNIVAIKISPFYFPNIASTGNTDFFYYRRVYMLIAGMARQSTVQSHNATSYHFEFDIENVNSTAVKLIPTQDTIYLQAPLTALSSLIVTFYRPINFRPIPIPADTLLVVPDPAGLATGDFIVVNGSATDIAPIGVLTPPGVAVFFAGFNSGNIAIDNAINADGGVFVTEVMTATTFRVGFAIANAPSTYMIIGKNRIAFQMRFTCLDPNVENGAIPTHI